MAEDDVLMPKLPPHLKTGEQVVVAQCPQCGCVEQFTNVCDEAGCRRRAGCGWPSENGYRRTCYEHSKIGKLSAENEKIKAQAKAAGLDADPT